MVLVAPQGFISIANKGYIWTLCDRTLVCTPQNLAFIHRFPADFAALFGITSAGSPARNVHPKSFTLSSTNHLKSEGDAQPVVTHFCCWKLRRPGIYPSPRA